jgi:YesN/AraC family two-component response regulator
MNEETQRLFILLYQCQQVEKALREILGKGYNLISVNEFQELKGIEQSLEFIFSECNNKCSAQCREPFIISNSLKIPLGIVRILSTQKEFPNFVQFVCEFFNSKPLSFEQEKIVKLIKESKFYVSLSKPDYGKPLRNQIDVIYNLILEKELKGLNVSTLSKEFPFSRSYLSNQFKKITGKKLKEFINQIKICHSLHLISLGEPLWRISKKLGYRDQGSFTKVFKKFFGLAPEFFKNKINF